MSEASWAALTDPTDKDAAPAPPKGFPPRQAQTRQRCRSTHEKDRPAAGSRVQNVFVSPPGKKKTVNWKVKGGRHAGEEEKSHPPSK